MRAILFVCTANQCRSPVAEMIFREALNQKSGAGHMTVKSAGTWTKSGLKVAPGILSLAQKIGVDLRGFTTTSIEDLQLEAFDWIVVMEKNHKEALDYEHPALRNKIHLLTVLAGEYASDIPDPVRMDADNAVRVLVDLQRLVRQVFERVSEGGI